MGQGIFDWGAPEQPYHQHHCVLWTALPRARSPSQSIFGVTRSDKFIFFCVCGISWESALTCRVFFFNLTKISAQHHVALPERMIRTTMHLVKHRLQEKHCSGSWCAGAASNLFTRALGSNRRVHREIFFLFSLSSLF